MNVCINTDNNTAKDRSSCAKYQHERGRQHDSAEGRRQTEATAGVIEISDNAGRLNAGK